MKFLHDPTTLKENVQSFFAMSPKTVIFALASEIWSKYFKETQVEGNENIDVSESSPAKENVSLSDEACLESAIGRS